MVVSTSKGREREIMARSMQGISKLLSAMKKMSREVNDHEICRRLETLINTEQDDLSANLSRKIFENPLDLEPRDILEPYTQYVMHYVYMLKRESRLEEKAKESGKPIKKLPSKKKGTASSSDFVQHESKNGKKTVGTRKKRA